MPNYFFHLDYGLSAYRKEDFEAVSNGFPCENTYHIYCAPEVLLGTMSNATPGADTYRYCLHIPATNYRPAYGEMLKIHSAVYISFNVSFKSMQCFSFLTVFLSSQGQCETDTVSNIHGFLCLSFSYSIILVEIATRCDLISVSVQTDSSDNCFFHCPGKLFPIISVIESSPSGTVRDGEVGCHVATFPP